MVKPEIDQIITQLQTIDQLLNDIVSKLPDETDLEYSKSLGEHIAVDFDDGDLEDVCTSITTAADAIQSLKDYIEGML